MTSIRNISDASLTSVAEAGAVLRHTPNTGVRYHIPKALPKTNEALTEGQHGLQQHNRTDSVTGRQKKKKPPHSSTLEFQYLRWRIEPGIFKFCPQEQCLWFVIVSCAV